MNNGPATVLRIIVQLFHIENAWNIAVVSVKSFGLQHYQALSFDPLYSNRWNMGHVLVNEH